MKTFWAENISPLQLLYYRIFDIDRDLSVHDYQRFSFEQMQDSAEHEHEESRVKILKLNRGSQLIEEIVFSYSVESVFKTADEQALDFGLTLSQKVGEPNLKLFPVKFLVMDRNRRMLWANSGGLSERFEIDSSFIAMELLVPFGAKLFLRLSRENLERLTAKVKLGLNNFRKLLKSASLEFSDRLELFLEYVLDVADERSSLLWFLCDGLEQELKRHIMCEGDFQAVFPIAYRETRDLGVELMPLNILLVE